MITMMLGWIRFDNFFKVVKSADVVFVINIGEISVRLNQKKTMKNLLLASVLLLISSALLAQNAVKKGDIVIHLAGTDYSDHTYNIDIYKKGNSTKIVYAYRDSLKGSKVKADPEYRRIHNNMAKYSSADTKRNPAWDTIGMIFEKYYAYTRDSITLNLKTDTSYSNLLQHVAKADKAQLAPKIDVIVLDGNGMIINIITADKNVQAEVSNPEEKTHPLLVGFISNTLNKDRNSSAVQKIRKYYIDFR